MQVTNSLDFISHAVIGQKKSIDFQITNDAEFFQILSSTLYKDQQLAVVREVICNAWDAHIEAGITDTPIKVTVTDEEFIVRDFGKGIHDDDMGPIYGTYGGSTKKNDGKQTGGFGLGCKSPFAYTDHFEVISCHQGTKTIYSLSRSSAAVQGRPGISTIVSVPTDETGLTVKIRLKPNDSQRFQHLASGIMRNGSMNATLNGEKIKPLDLDLEPESWIMAKGIQFYRPQGWWIFIRYGNVIYPVEDNIAYSTDYQGIRHFLSKLSYGNFNLILQAHPHSISVTPSRESLSMQEKTIKSLTELLKGFYMKLTVTAARHSMEMVRDAITEAIQKGQLGRLCFNLDRLPIQRRVSETFLSTSSIENTVTEIIHQTAYREFPVLRQYDQEHRLKALETSGLVERGLIQGLKKELNNSRVGYSKWFQAAFIKKLARDLQQIPGGTIKRVYVMTNAGRAVMASCHITQHTPYALEQALPLTRRLVFFAESRKQALTFADRYPEHEKLGDVNHSFIYLVPSKKEHRDEAKAVFEKLGYRVYDMTIEQPWLPSEVKVVAAPKPRKTTKGYPILSAAVRNGNVLAPIEWPKVAKHLENAEFYAVARKSRNKYHESWAFDDIQGRFLKTIIEKFGDQGVALTSSTQMGIMKKRGAIPANAWYARRICQEVESNSRVMSYLTNSLESALPNPHYTLQRRTEFFRKYPPIIKHYGFLDPRTKEDIELTKLWVELESYGGNCGYMFGGSHDDCPIKKLRVKINGSHSQGVLEAIKKIETDVRLKMLDFEHLVHLDISSMKQGQQDALEALIMSIVKS